MNSTPFYLIIRPELAPYRVDFFNDVLARNPNGRLIFLVLNEDQTFSHDLSYQRLTAPYSFAPFPAGMGRHWAFLGIRALLRRFKPGIVVTTEYSVISVLFALLVRARPGLKLIVWTDDSADNLEHNFTWGRRLRRRLVLGAAKALVCCNTRVRDFYCRQFPGLPVFCSRILQDPEVVSAALSDARPLAEEYVERYRLRGKKVILFVGRLHPVKNLPRLIRAFAAIPEGRRAGLVLAIVGDGKLLGALQALARSLAVEPSVIFAGQQQGRPLWAWYTVGQVLVLPSVNERFGAVVNEALLAGMPVLCSNRAGAEDLIEPGVNGELIDPLDIPELSLKLEQTLARLPPVASIEPRPDRMLHAYRESVQAFLSAIQTTAGADSAGVKDRP
jgi:glycosyltransferase involved in cell wall biosynthesis